MEDASGYSGRLRKRKRVAGGDDGSEESVRSLLELAEACGKLVIFTGSGLSANSGMSMFTTKNGLYERARQRLKISDGIKLFSYPFYKQRRNDVQAFFAQIYSEAQSSRAAPGHVALAQLHALGRLQRHYTLNIDGLAQVVGMDTWHHEHNPEGITVEMHGNISYVVCPSCHAVASLTGSVMTTMKASLPVLCSACKEDDMRFKVMLYDDEQGDCITPEDVFERLEDDLGSAGAVLWVGISFEQSASTEYFRKVRHMLASQGRSVPQVILNPSEEPYFNVVSTMSNKEDVQVLDVRGTSDDVLPRLVQHLHKLQGTKPDAASMAAAAEAAAAAAAASRKRKQQDAVAAAAAAAAAGAGAPASQRARRGSSARDSPAPEAAASGAPPPSVAVCSGMPAVIASSAELAMMDSAAAAALALPPAVQKHFLQRQQQQQQGAAGGGRDRQQQQQQHERAAAAAQASAVPPAAQNGVHTAAAQPPPAPQAAAGVSQAAAAVASNGLQQLLSQLQALHALQAAAAALPAQSLPPAAAGLAGLLPPAPQLQTALPPAQQQPAAPNPLAALLAGSPAAAQLTLAAALANAAAANGAGAAGNGQHAGVNGHASTPAPAAAAVNGLAAAAAAAGGGGAPEVAAAVEGTLQVAAARVKPDADSEQQPAHVSEGGAEAAAMSLGLGATDGAAALPAAAVKEEVT